MLTVPLPLHSTCVNCAPPPPQHLRVNWALSGPGGQNSTDDFPVFVGDLPPEVDEDLLQRHFAKFGNVV